MNRIPEPRPPRAELAPLDPARHALEARIELAKERLFAHLDEAQKQLRRVAASTARGMARALLVGGVVDARTDVYAAGPRGAEIDGHVSAAHVAASWIRTCVVRRSRSIKAARSMTALNTRALAQRRPGIFSIARATA